MPGAATDAVLPVRGSVSVCSQQGLGNLDVMIMPVSVPAHAAAMLPLPAEDIHTARRDSLELELVAAE